jgi:hypothetical protein
MKKSEGTAVLKSLAEKTHNRMPWAEKTGSLPGDNFCHGLWQFKLVVCQRKSQPTRPY